MLNSTVVTSRPMQPAAMMPPARRPMNVRTLRGLAIAQIVHGVLTFVLGICAAAVFNKNYWLTEAAPGIWGGIWIFVTGVIGVISTTRPESLRLNNTHMAFCIISTIVASIHGIMFAVGLGFYNHCKNRHTYYYSYRYSYGYNYGYSYRSSYYSGDYRYCSSNSAGVVIYTLLVLLMSVEFFVALVAAVSCSQGACLSRFGGGVIFQQQQPQYIVTTSSSNPAYVTSSGYPATTVMMTSPQFNAYQQPATIPNTTIAYSQYPQQQQQQQQQQQNSAPQYPPPQY